MMTRSSRLTREGLERAAHELAGLSLTTTELEALLGRLKSIREALGALQARIGTECEPLPGVRIEDEDE